MAKIYAKGKEVKYYLDANSDCWDDQCGAVEQLSGLGCQFDPSRPEGGRLVKIMTMAMHGTDVGIIHGGTLSGDKICRAGPAQRESLLEFHPFGNEVAKIYSTAKEIKDFLDANLDCWEDQCGAVVQLPGLRCRFDSSRPEGGAW